MGNESATPEQKLATPGQLAEFLGVPISWIYARTRENSIPVIRCGKYCRFDLRAVIEWLNRKNNETE